MFFWLYFHSLPYLEMCTDCVNNTSVLLRIVNTMSILFFWSYGYIFTNYHIWKFTQTMLTLLQHCQQQSTSCLLFFCLFSPDFLAIFAIIAILGNAHRPHEQCTHIVNNSIQVSILFLCFSPTLWLCLCQLPYLEMRTDHVDPTPTLSITVYVMSILFFSFFSDFLAIFTLLTIFGNVHRPCKQYPNIVNNSLHHACSFFLSFPDFLAIFMSITILENAHRPCKQLSNITTPSLFFSYEITKFTIFGNF